MLGFNRFPIFYQLDSLDCGPSCLQMIAKHYGRALPKHLVARLCEQDRQGASLASLARGAEKLGFRTLAVKVSFDELRDKAPMPCVAYWSQGHFVVVHKVRRDWGILLLIEPCGRSLETGTNQTTSSRSHLWRPLWRDTRRRMLPIGLAI